MGMCAELVAIGPYSRRVAEALDYRSDRYSDTREGAILSRRLLGIVEGSGLTREFAALLGITDPWDFNQHKLSRSGVDLGGLWKWSVHYPDYQRDLAAFEILLAEGFEFHFRPEG
jgi:hypothetical protein